MNVKDLQVTVVGLARSGVGAARLLNHLGARVTVRDASGATQLREVSGGGATWGTQDSGLLHVGLGAQGGDVTVTVRWPDGRTSQHTLAVDRAWRILRDAAPAPLP